MGTITAYSIAVSVVMLALWLIYRMLLAQENQPAFNRCVLLAIYAASFAAPLLPSLKTSVPTQTVQVAEVVIGEITAVIAEPVAKSDGISGTTIAAIIALIYLSGVAVGVVHALIGWIKVARLVARNNYILVDNIKVVITDGIEFPSPFSWMGYVVISQKDYESVGGKFILTHEMRHISLHHPVDVFIAQLSVILCWFSPAPYLLRSELRDVHEYQADLAVLQSGADAREYQLLLIKKAVGKKFPALANSLNHSKLKKRITMMSNKNNSSRGARMRALALVPVLGLTLIALNCAPVVNALSKISDARNIDELIGLKNDSKFTYFSDDIQTITSEETENLTIAAPEMTQSDQTEVASPVNDDNKVYKSVKQLPQFPGGEKALFEFIAKNLRYPESEKENSNTVRLLVRFVVEADGKIGEIKLLRGGPEVFNQEAIRVIKMLPSFIPGKNEDGQDVAVWYNLPIIFKSTPVKTETSASASAPVTADADKPATKVIPDSDRPGVFRSVEKMPQFPGGEMALLEFVAANIRYPEAEAKEKQQGRVVVSFIVEADGSIGDVKILRSRGEGFDAEAIRVIKMLPNFIPGQSGGKNVAAWYNLPVIFKLMEDQPKAE